MWFVLLSVALAITAVGGLYFRWRILGALEILGVKRSTRRLVGIAIPWLLYGFPVLVFALVAISLALDRESVSMSLPPIGEWLLAYPFWFAILVALQSIPFFLAIDFASLIARRLASVDRVARVRAYAALGIVAVIAIYTPARIVLERGQLDLHHYKVGDGSGEPLRIAFFADLQIDRHTNEERAEEVVALINREAPDVVLVGGDWINSGPGYIDAAGRVASKIASRLGVFSVRGDHEHFAYRDRHRSVAEVTASLARHGVEMLDNEVRVIDHDGARIGVLYLSYNYIVRTPDAEIRSLVARVKAYDYSIVVTHQFDNLLAELVGDQVDLALIAHTHGGQVNPLVGFVHFPLARVETPYVAGRYKLGKTTLIVTSGIGFSIAPFRYASPASIEFVELRP